MSNKSKYVTPKENLEAEIIKHYDGKIEKGLKDIEDKHQTSLQGLTAAKSNADGKATKIYGDLRTENRVAGHNNMAAIKEYTVNNGLKNSGYRAYLEETEQRRYNAANENIYRAEKEKKEEIEEAFKAGVQSLDTQKAANRLTVTETNEEFKKKAFDYYFGPEVLKVNDEQVEYANKHIVDEKTFDRNCKYVFGSTREEIATAPIMYEGEAYENGYKDYRSQQLKKLYNSKKINIGTLLTLMGEDPMLYEGAVYNEMPYEDIIKLKKALKSEATISVIGKKYNEIAPELESFIKGYNQRFYDSAGNYISEYRSDSKEWYEKTAKDADGLADALVNLRTIILNYCIQNGKDEYTESLLKYVNESIELLNGVKNVANDDYEVMRQYNNQEEYNDALYTNLLSQFDLSNFFNDDVLKAEAIQKMKDMKPTQYNQEVFENYLKAIGKMPAVSNPNALQNLYYSEYVGGKAALNITNEFRVALEKAGFDSSEDLENALDFAYLAKEYQNQGKYIPYEIFSKNEDFEQLVAVGSKDSKLKEFFELNDGLLNYMTGQERQVLYYICAKNGIAAAKKHIDTHLYNLLLPRRHNETLEKWSEFGEKHPWIATRLRPAAKMVSGTLNFLSDAYEYTASKGGHTYIEGIDMYDPLSVFAQGVEQMSGAAREKVVGDNKAIGVIYDVVMGVADAATTLGTAVAITTVTGGSAASVAALLSALPAASSTMIEAKQRGLSDDQAFKLGLATVAIEYVTEKISLDSLLKPAGGLVSSIFRNGAVQVTEELAAGFLNLVADCVIAGDESKFSLGMEKYRIENNVSYEEAFKHQLTETFDDIGYESMIGGLVGIFLGSGRFNITSLSPDGNVESNRSKYTSIGNILKSGNSKNLSSVLQYVSNMDGGASFNQLLKNGVENIPDETVGMLYVTVEQDIVGNYLAVDGAAELQKVFVNRYKAADSNFIKNLEYKAYIQSMYIDNVLDKVAIKTDSDIQSDAATDAFKNGLSGETATSRNLSGVSRNTSDTDGTEHSDLDNNANENVSDDDLQKLFVEGVNGRVVEQPESTNAEALDTALEKVETLNEGNKRLEKVDIHDIIISDKQFGKKIGKHAKDFGLDASVEADRQKVKNIINDIIINCDEIRIGDWRGQIESVYFYIKGKDVVIVTSESNRFVSVLKGGVDNVRVKNARKR